MATVKLTEKPVAEAVQGGDQVVLIQGGAVKRIAAKQVGTKWPAQLDLSNSGIVVDPTALGTMVTCQITEELQAQIKDAALAGGAWVTFAMKMPPAIPIQVKAFLAGAALEINNAYELCGKFFYDAQGVNVAVIVNENVDPPTAVTVCTFDADLPLAETASEGAFLRVQNGSWAAVQVPEAEEVSF